LYQEVSSIDINEFLEVFQLIDSPVVYLIDDVWKRHS